MRRQLLAVAAAALILHLGTQAGAQEQERKLFAHYMGCFPVASGPTLSGLKSQPKLKHDASDFLSNLGGGIRNWYLAPVGLALTPEQSAELEIKRALRGGVDGFAIDAWAGSNDAKRSLDALFAAAEKSQAKFQITICMDASCLPKNQEEPGNNVKAYGDAIKYLLDKHGSSPNLARRDAKPLIFGYSSYGIYQTKEMKALPEGPEKWQKTADAFKEVERLAGTPLFFHFCLAHYGHYASKEGTKKDSIVDFAGFIAKHVGAAGAFLDEDWSPELEARIASAVKASGAEWSQPLWHQYENMRGGLNAGKGTDILRDRWERAIKNGSTLLQFVTWNDYGESTILAPGINTGYSILELNAYFAKMWKSGKAPAIDHDQLFITFKKYPKDAETFPFRSRRSNEGALEVLSLLTAPGTVRLPGRDVEWQAPAGLFVKQLPLTPGSVSAELLRNGKSVQRLDSPELISDKPFREDNSVYSVSTDYEADWKADFLEAPVFHYSEYGDADNDGLPNWFEMYWQGKWFDFDSMTSLNPNDDPFKSGRTLLKSYQERKDPRKPNAVYAPGCVWDLKEIPQRNTSFNPDFDAQGSKTWLYLYKHGPYGKMERSGDFEKCPHTADGTSYTGRMAHFSPYKDEVYHQVYGWTCWQQDKDTKEWSFQMRPRKEAMIALAWIAPCDGTFKASVSAKASESDKLWLGIREPSGKFAAEGVVAGKESPLKLESGALKLAKGQAILFVSDSAPGNGGGSILCDELKVQMLESN